MNLHDIQGIYESNIVKAHGFFHVVTISLQKEKTPKRIMPRASLSCRELIMFGSFTQARCFYDLWHIMHGSMELSWVIGLPQKFILIHPWQWEFPWNKYHPFLETPERRHGNGYGNPPLNPRLFCRQNISTSTAARKSPSSEAFVRRHVPIRKAQDLAIKMKPMLHAHWIREKHVTQSLIIWPIVGL